MNEPLYWRTNNGRTFRSAFLNALSFNNPSIIQWDMSNAVDISSMFSGALAFNVDIVDWSVNNLRILNKAFQDAIAFNSNIGSWNTSRLESMAYAFDGAAAFDQDLSRWTVDKVYNFTGAFARSGLSSGTLRQWNVSSACAMDSMFANATLFESDLNIWQNELDNKTCDGTNLVSVENMFRGTSCQIQDTMTLDDKFCRYGFSLKMCVMEEFDAGECNCTKPTQCLKHLRTNSTCEEQFIASGRPADNYDRRVNITFQKLCGYM